MMSFVHFSGYRFVPLQALPALRERLLAVSHAGKLRGTILLSPEGINLFVSGSRDAVDALLQHLRAEPGLEGLTGRESLSKEQPYNRMLVKIKKEIIAFGIEGIDPCHRPSPKLPARVLKEWLDGGRPVTLLDTRNRYEVKMGTFREARRAGIDRFRDFPDAVARLPAALKEETVVLFCTGGIRCEKAAPYMEAAGFRDVHQLDGGILKYFEECGGAHFEGECFVFDRRVGVDSALRETGSEMCFNCQMPLTVAEQRHPAYVVGKSCPHCAAPDSAAPETGD